MKNRAELWDISKNVIPDDENRFPNSIVNYTEFNIIEIQHVFAALREFEEIYQRDLGTTKHAEVLVEEAIRRLPDAEKKRFQGAFKAGQLAIIQRLLIWFAHECIQGVHTRRDWRSKKEKNQRATEKQISIFSIDGRK